MPELSPGPPVLPETAECAAASSCAWVTSCCSGETGMYWICKEERTGAWDWGRTLLVYCSGHSGCSESPTHMHLLFHISPSPALLRAHPMAAPSAPTTVPGPFTCGSWRNWLPCSYWMWVI